MTTRVPRPTDIRIGALTWAITYDRAAFRAHELGSNKRLLGSTVPARSLILIDDIDLPETTVRATLLHEVLHAIWWTFHLDGGTSGEDVEENAVARLEAPLLGVLRDNPVLVRFLTAHAPQESPHGNA